MSRPSRPLFFPFPFFIRIKVRSVLVRAIWMGYREGIIGCIYSLYYKVTKSVNAESPLSHRSFLIRVA